MRPPAAHCLLVAAIIALLGAVRAQAADPPPPPNVLFIAVDDLRAELGCYGAEHVISPNIDRLAASGVRFEKAYCQQAICGPSRASVMTGLRPDSSQIHGNHTHFRNFYPDLHTLPQHFKEHGYHAQSMGKLYHGVFPEGSSRTVPDTFGDEPSWSVPTFRPGPRYYYTEEGIAAAQEVYKRIYNRDDIEGWDTKLVFGPATESPDVSDDTLYDGQVAAAAVQALGERADAPDEPFFLAVGFIKPHSPYIAPKKYFDLYDPELLPAQVGPDFPEGAPAIAGHGSGEVRRYTDQPGRGAIPDENQRRVRHAYFACISYIDAQIGRVLDALEENDLADNTIVALWSDHGYHLGEKGLWGKTTNFELDTRVPLILRDPRRQDSAGSVSEGLAELVDLYPTLSDLAGLPVPAHCEGTSLAPLLENPDRPWKGGAFSQFGRGGGVRGHSVTDGRHRYTEWRHLETGEVRATELYDHAADPDERNNLAASQPETATRMGELLAGGAGWRAVRNRLAQPALGFADVFRDHMVLQRDKPIPIWGHAPAGSEVVVRFGGQEKAATADPGGRWRAVLDPLPADAHPQPLTLRSADLGEVGLEDILIGEVWLCAGQSNMRWELGKSEGAAAHLAAADLPEIRLIDHRGTIYPTSKTYDLLSLRAIGADNYYTTEGWSSCTPDTAKSFSGVAYFFGRELHAELGVPIGLIHNAVGGVPMDSYIPEDRFRSDPRFAPLINHWLYSENFPTWCRTRARLNLDDWINNYALPFPAHPFKPGFLFESGVKPYAGMAIGGFLWYQGESNATENGASGGPIDPRVNFAKHQMLIEGWRAAWGDPELPFAFAQLPGLNRDWPDFREVQSKIDEEVPHTMMAITLDLGHPTNVHPSNKAPVGARLARLALAGVYGADDPDAPGPLVDQITLDGSTAEVSFLRPITTSDGSPPRTFTVAGEDRAFLPADAEVISATTIRLSAPGLTEIVAVRYAWENDPDTNLVNGDGLPARPFRSDTWPLPSERDRPLQRGPAADALYFTSFEDLPGGDFDKLEVDGARWSRTAGDADIDQAHASTGSQSLRMGGGDEAVVELHLPEPLGEAATLHFRAERWTKREPFTFTIEAPDQGAPLYDGTAEITIGGGLPSRAVVALPPNTQTLRLRCIAPPRGGILLDDIQIDPAE